MRSAIVASMAAATMVGLAGCERAKTRLDREVDRVCASDGGVHIYETVTLPKENFGPDGEIFPQFRSDVMVGGGLGPDYEWTSINRQLVDGDPSLLRWEHTITRRQDGKVLGKRIVYVRSGGDLPRPWALSEQSCRNAPLVLSSAANEVTAGVPCDARRFA